MTKLVEIYFSEYIIQNNTAYVPSDLPKITQELTEETCMSGIPLQRENKRQMI